MKKSIYLFLFILSFGCNNCPEDETGLISEQTIFDENLKTIGEIGSKLKDLELVLRKKGVKIDSNYSNLNEVEKLKYLTDEINQYILITYRFTNSKPKSLIVKKDSLYEGCMLFSAYNAFSVNKLILSYNNKIQEIPMSEDRFECRYKLKPYKLGENICTGYMIQGRDTYPFENRFIAIK